MKFVGLDGLKHFWSKAKTWIIDKITTEVTAKIAEIVANAPEDLDTLKEIADWISSHADDAAAMNTQIAANTSDIATLKTSVAGKSDTGHTHTQSEITDFPTSLPANGGTATKATQDGSGNVITSTYVKKSGDTLTSSTSDTPLYVNTTASGKTKSWIGFQIGSVSKNYIGADQNGLYSYTNSKNNKILDTSAQTLTDEEKTQVRSNIGAGTSSLTIGTTETTAAAGNHTHSGYLTAHQDISGKLNVDGSNATNTGTSAIVHSLDTATGDVTDDTEIITSNDSGYSSSDTKYYKRAGSKVWNYIKSKISSVLGLTATNYSGKASTAGTADKTVNDISIDIPHVAESGQYVIPLGNILEPTSTATESPYNWDIAGFFSITRLFGHNGSHIQFEAGHGYSHDWTTYAYLDKFDFKHVTTSIKAFQYEGKWWLGLCIVTINQGYFGKMTITYSRGLPATPTCILYYSQSGGIANEEINNSIQDIPSSWWRQRTICNPTTFNDKLYANGLIIPRQGTYDGATVSIGRSDGNIIIGDTNNNNTGYTVINNDCGMKHDLEVFGESNFVGPCFFNEDIYVHGKSLFPSGYVPRTYYMYGKDLNTLTTADKALLKKLFAFMIFARVSALNFTLSYKINNTVKFIDAIGYGYTDYEGIINIDNNDDITMSSDFFCNCCNLIGDNGYEGAYKVVDAYDLAGRLLKDDWANFTYLTFYGTFTLLEKV